MKRFPRRNGDRKQMLLDRLSQPTDKGCMEFVSGRDPCGYGKLHVGGRQYRAAHRVAYEEFIGPLPDRAVVCHSCDNPPCCNPAHLWLGTKSGNAMDSVAKGRHTNAAKTHCSRGHEFTPQNTYWRPKGDGRDCKSCRAMHQENYRAAHSA